MILLANDEVKGFSAISATSTATGFDSENLANDLRSSVWRSTAITTQTIQIEWGSAKTIDCCGIAFANFLVNSTVRIRLYTNIGDGSPVVDSGSIDIDYVFSPPSGFSTNDMSSLAFGGGNYFFRTLTSASVRRMDVTVTNPSGSFIDISRIAAGEHFEAEFGALEGTGVGFSDTSEKDLTESGNVIVDRRISGKRLTIDLGALVNIDRIQVQDLIRRNATHTPVFVSAYDSSSTESMRMDHMIYGRIENLGIMELISTKGWSSYNIQVSEI